MIEKIINTVRNAESEADGLKRMAPLATQLGQLNDAAVEQLIGELATLATSADLTPLPDEQGQWKTRLDLLIPIVHGLLVRSLKQDREAAEKKKKSEASALSAHGCRKRCYKHNRKRRSDRWRLVSADASSGRYALFRHAT